MSLMGRVCRRFGWVDKEGSALFWSHSQNLTEDQFGRTRGIWRHGRSWHHTPVGCFAFCWQIPTRFLHVGFSIGGGDGELFGLEIACKVFALWFHFEPKKWRHVEDRSYELSWHNGGLWWQWGTNRFGDMPDYGRPPWWRRWHFDPLNFLFGRLRSECRNLATAEAEIPAPERSYPAGIVFGEQTWTRRRWPWWPLRRVRCYAEVTLFEPIPIPGKGENSWDCGEDAIHSMGCSATTVEGAVAAVVESYTGTRRRHGGEGWKPASAEQRR